MNRVCAIYAYGRLGIGSGIYPVSVTFRRLWSKFRTSSAIRISQFEGLARFPTGGGAKWTWNYLNMMGLPPGVNTIPTVLSIDTGFIVGVGESTSLGPLIWVPREEMIYNGD